MFSILFLLKKKKTTSTTNKKDFKFVNINSLFYFYIFLLIFILNSIMTVKKLIYLLYSVLMFIFLQNKIDLLLENPLAGQFQFKNPALATVNNDNNNNFCVVDDSGQRIVILN